MSFSDVLSIFALFLSALSLFVTTIFNQRAKQADIQDSCHNRFDRLQELRAELLRRYESGAPPGMDANMAAKSEVAVFFSRFWSLQFDQFVAWHQGNIPQDVYVFWARSRWRQLRNPTPDWCIAGETMETSLKRILGDWKINPVTQSNQRDLVTSFLGLMDGLRIAVKESEVERLLVEYGPDPAAYL